MSKAPDHGAEIPAGADFDTHQALCSSHVGRRIREARKGAGLTQAALAKRLGVASASVSEAESLGLSTLPALARYARAIGTTVIALAYGDNRAADQNSAAQ